MKKKIILFNFIYISKVIYFIILNVKVDIYVYLSFINNESLKKLHILFFMPKLKKNQQ